jgi:hypothetical protein
VRNRDAAAERLCVEEGRAGMRVSGAASRLSALAKPTKSSRLCAHPCVCA